MRPSDTKPHLQPLPALIPLPKAPTLLGLSRSTIYRAVHDGRLALKKVGRSSFITAASAIAFVEGLPDAPLAITDRGGVR